MKSILKVVQGTFRLRRPHHSVQALEIETKGAKEPMQILFRPDDFNGLISLLEEDSGSEIVLHCPFGNTAFFTGSSNELYIRSGFPNRLEIARMTVNQRRSGIGTQVLAWLMDYAKMKGFDAIYIECIQSEAMRNFAEKHGFSYKDDGGWGQSDGHFGNWERTL